MQLRMQPASMLATPVFCEFLLVFLCLHIPDRLCQVQDCYGCSGMLHKKDWDQVVFQNPRTLGLLKFCCHYGICLVLPKTMKLYADGGIFVRHDLRREQSRVTRTGVADGECADGDAAGHLHDG